MTTKEMIEFLEKDVMDWDGWELEEMDSFVAIIKRLEKHEELKEELRVYKNLYEDLLVTKE